MCCVICARALGGLLGDDRPGSWQWLQWMLDAQLCYDGFCVGGFGEMWRQGACMLLHPLAFTYLRDNLLCMV